MPRPRSVRVSRLLLVATAALGVAFAALADDAAPRQIYKWIDANGIAHYTTDPDRIPKALRNRISPIERAPSRPEAPTPTASPPARAGAEPGPAVGDPVEIVAPPSGTAVGGEAWATRDALPRPRDGSSILAEGEATPAQREAVAREQESLDARIAELESAIARDEGVLKDLISDPELDGETPIFDRPEFLEISERLPQLQAQLDELRGQREQLGTP